jgi:hypothetical protein
VHIVLAPSSNDVHIVLTGGDDASVSGDTDMASFQFTNGNTGKTVSVIASDAEHARRLMAANRRTVLDKAATNGKQVNTIRMAEAADGAWIEAVRMPGGDVVPTGTRLTTMTSYFTPRARQARDAAWADTYGEGTINDAGQRVY